MYRIVVLYKILWLLFVNRSPRLQSCSNQFCCGFWYYSIYWFLRTHTPVRFSPMFPANRSIASYHHCISCQIDQGVAVLPSSSTTAFLTSIRLLPFSNNRQRVLVSSLLDIFLLATIVVRFFLQAKERRLLLFWGLHNNLNHRDTVCLETMFSVVFLLSQAMCDWIVAIQ